MTNLQVVQLLRSRGNTIDFVRRKDGSIRITYINGEKFSARESIGNNLARSMAGQQLSESTVKQRARASKYAGKGVIKAGREITLKNVSSSFLRAYKKAQAELRKYRKKHPGEENPFAVLRSDKLLRAIRYEGEEGIIERIQEQVQAIKGIARRDHVEVLRSRLERYSWGKAISDKYLGEGATLSAGAVDIAIRYLYDMNKGDKTTEQVATLIEKALSLSVEEAPTTNKGKEEYRRTESRMARGVSKVYKVKKKG